MNESVSKFLYFIFIFLHTFCVSDTLCSIHWSWDCQRYKHRCVLMGSSSFREESLITRRGAKHWGEAEVGERWEEPFMNHRTYKQSLWRKVSGESGEGSPGRGTVRAEAWRGAIKPNAGVVGGWMLWAWLKHWFMGKHCSSGCRGAEGGEWGGGCGGLAPDQK